MCGIDLGHVTYDLAVQGLNSFCGNGDKLMYCGKGV